MKKIKDIYKKYKGHLPYLVSALVIPLPWFFQRGYLLFMDSTFGPLQPLASYADHWFLYTLFVKILYYILPNALVGKIIYLLVFLLLIYGGRKIAQNFTSNKLIIFIASFFSLYNSFIYERAIYGQLGILLGVGFLYWAAGFLIEFYQKENFKALAYAVLFSVLTLMFSFHFVFLYLFLYLGFLAIIIIKKRYLFNKMFLKYLLIGLGFGILLNINWLVGLLFGSSQEIEYLKQGIFVQDLFVFKPSGNNALEVIVNLISLSGFWAKNNSAYIFNEPVLNLFFCLIFILIIYGAYKYFKKDKALSILFFSIIFISLILAIGMSMKYISSLNFWLFEHVPFYKGMRDSQKWVALLLPIYISFFTIGLVSFCKRIVNPNLKKVMPILLVVVMIFMVPGMMFGFVNKIQGAVYPTDWLLAEKSIRDNVPLQSKGIVLPWHMYMSFEFTKNRVIANPADHYFTYPLKKGQNMEYKYIFDNSVDEANQLVTDWFTKRQPISALEPISENLFFILFKEVDYSEYQTFLDSLVSKNQLRLIHDSENIRVYSE